MEFQADKDLGHIKSLKIHSNKRVAIYLDEVISKR